MSQELPDILSESEEGFADLVFAITSHEETPEGRHVFTAEALHGAEHVGLQVELSTQWKPGALGASIPAFSGVVTYRSVGTMSNRLVSLMDRLYETKLAPAAMRKSVRFAAITLGDDPGDLAWKEIHIKLFFEHEDQERYAEIYTNIDLPNQKLQIREKDEGYRKPVIHAIAESGQA
jgi:hypothetical protein